MPEGPLEFPTQLASNAANWTVNEFARRWTDEQLVLRPAFQRNLVWNAEQQSFLVDSVLRGLPIPEIYVHVKTGAAGDEVVTVVDGQQRISACLRFLRDELRCLADEDLDPRWRNKVFSELTDDLKQRFRSYDLIVRKLPDLGDGVLREVFRRLNKTVEPLEPQELRHAAYTGDFLQLVEDAAGVEVLGVIGVFSARDYLRRRNDEFVAEIAFALLASAYPNKKDGLEDLFLTFERQGIDGQTRDRLEAQFGRVFAQLEAFAPELRRTRFRNKSDFYTLFVVLAKNAAALPAESSAELGKVLRDFSALVNDLKAAEADGELPAHLVGGPTGEAALRYLRAVERAATDRLNRVRRDEALHEVLGPVLAQSTPTELGPQDRQWRLAIPADDAETVDEMAADKSHLEESLAAEEPPEVQRPSTS